MDRAGRDRRGAQLTRHLDEDDVRVRPGRGTRPRTRDRPRHDDALAAVVVRVDRGRYACRTGAGELTAMRARELGRRSVVVGDRVAVVGDRTGAPGTLARIVRVEPRRSALRRTADDTDPVERVIVANADQLVVVCALADPPPRAGLVDRCLVAAFDAGIDPLLCLTKSDLADAAPLLRRFAPAAVPAVTVGRTDGGRGRAELHDRLLGRTSVLVGHSGVGKSTLVNALVPGAARSTGAVNPVTGRGRHVSSSVVALPLAAGWIVDTPGVRSFGLGHVPPDRLLAAFPDLAPGAAGCPPGCDHLGPACALPDRVAAGHAAADRLASLRRLLVNRAAET